MTESTDAMNETLKSLMSIKTYSDQSEMGDLKQEDKELFQLCGKEEDFVKKMQDVFGSDLFNSAY